MEHRKVADEKEARALLRKVARSGDDVGAWARARGIDGRSLNAWKINLGRRGVASSDVPTGRAPRCPGAPRLVELIPTLGVASPPSPRRTDGARYTLRVTGIEVEFGDDARADTLQRIVEALRSC